MKRKNHVIDPILAVTIVFVVLILTIFILLPLVSVLRESFQGENGFTLDVYRTTLANIQFGASLRNTLMLGTVSGAISTFVGFVFAYAENYLHSRFAKLFNVVSILPIISPPFVLGLSMLMLFGQQGLISKRLLHMENSNIYGLRGLILVQVMTFFPVAYMMLTGMLKNIDASLEEAAMDMGASRWQTFCRVTLPLMMPGLANAFLINFIESIADFSNPMVIGGNFTTLATQIYIQAIGNYDIRGGSSIAVILLAISTALFIIEKYWIERRTYVTVTGKASREKTFAEDPRVAAPINAICFAVTVIVLGLYLLVPVSAFFKVWGMDYSLTLKNFAIALDSGRKAIADTTLLSAIATPITAVLTMVIAFLIVRKRFLGRKFIEFTSLMVMAVPGTVIGVGYILCFNDKPLALTGTAAIIVIAFIMRRLPIGVRSGVAALAQIDKSIEEAGYNLGANTVTVFTKITLPLIKSAIFTSLVYTFVRSMTSVSNVIFLVSPKSQLMTVSMLAQVDDGRFGVAAAYATILILIVGAAVVLMKLMLKNLGSSEEVQL